VRYRLVLRGDRTGLIIIIDKIKFRAVITSIRAAVPPVPNDVIDESEITIHAYRWAAADIRRPKITHKGSIQPTKRATKRVIICIQRFRENGILNRYIDGR